METRHPNVAKEIQEKHTVGRRDFFKGAAAGAAALVGTRAGGGALVKGVAGGAAALAASSAGNALAAQGGGIAAYTLTVSAVTWPVGGGKSVNAYAYNGTVPGPTLRAKAGDILEITVNNNLGAETTVHWHGVHPIPNDMDGVAIPAVGLPAPIPSPGSAVYTFPAPPPGTYVYHSHVDVTNQIPRGLYGLLVVDDPVPGIRAAVPRGQHADMRFYDRELPLVLGTFPGSIVVGGGPAVEVINGKAFYGLDDLVEGRNLFNMSRGERVLFRVWNSSNAVHPMHTHGMGYIVVATDGMDLEVPVRKHNLGVNAGEGYDIIVHADTPGVWLFHCHNLAHVVGGMVAVNIVS